MKLRPRHRTDAGPEELGTLFRRHRTELFGFLRRMSRDATVADDLTQEVFLRVLRYRASFDGERAFRPWLFRIARNVWADRRAEMRGDAVRLPGPRDQSSDRLEAEIPDPRPTQQRELEAKERLTRLEWALGHLSEAQRSALILARFHDLSYREIGEVLDCSEGAVKARVFRALRTLSKLVDQSGETDR